MSVVALVFSNWTVQKINDFFEDYLDAKSGDIGLIKVERYRNKKGEMKDNNRTLILMKKELYEKALQEGLNYAQPNLDFRISELVLDARYLPYEGYDTNLYIIIPKSLSASDAETLLQNKLKTCVLFGLLKEEDYSLKVPLLSRITGEHRGFIICNFTDSVEVKNRAYIRALLHDFSFFIDINTRTLTYIPVLWTKKYKLPTIPKYSIFKK